MQRFNRSKRRQQDRKDLAVKLLAYGDAIEEDRAAALEMYREVMEDLADLICPGMWDMLSGSIGGLVCELP